MFPATPLSSPPASFGAGGAVRGCTADLLRQPSSFQNNTANDCRAGPLVLDSFCSTVVQTVLVAQPGV